MGKKRQYVISGRYKHSKMGFSLFSPVVEFITKNYLLNLWKSPARTNVKVRRIK